ncbi:MAG: hypothetical protein ACLTMP_04645 [Eggerthella lenta]
MEIGNATVSNFNKANYGSLTWISSNRAFVEHGVRPARSRWALTSWSPEPRASASSEIDFPLYTPESLMPSASTCKESWGWHGQPLASRRRHHAPAARPGRLQATVLEMAMVGTAIANDGVIMQPYLVDSVNNANGERSFSASDETDASCQQDHGRTCVTCCWASCRTAPARGAISAST